MATLKDHQQAMVDLLASGSGIPASASRLAHAMHDVVDVLIAAFPNVPLSPDVPQGPKRIDATTPGLNDKALAADVEACRPKATRFNVDIKLADMDEVKTTLQNMQSHLDGARDSQRKAERRVKELENTVKQLRASNATMKQKLGESESDLQSALAEIRVLRLRIQPEQAGVRGLKDRVAKLKADRAYWYGRCPDAGILDESQEQAGCRKLDTQVCEHSWNYNQEASRCWCGKCGATRAMEDDE